jgi:hypothetical protein
MKALDLTKYFSGIESALDNGFELTLSRGKGLEVTDIGVLSKGSSQQIRLVQHNQYLNEYPFSLILYKLSHTYESGIKAFNPLIPEETPLLNEICEVSKTNHLDRWAQLFRINELSSVDLTFTADKSQGDTNISIRDLKSEDSRLFTFRGNTFSEAYLNLTKFDPTNLLLAVLLEGYKARWESGVLEQARQNNRL